MGEKIEKLHKEQSSHNRKHTVYKKMLVCSKKTPKLFMIKSNTMQFELKVLQTIQCRWDAVNFCRILQAGTKINQCRQDKEIRNAQIII